MFEKHTIILCDNSCGHAHCPYSIDNPRIEKFLTGNDNVEIKCKTMSDCVHYNNTSGMYVPM